MVDVTDHGDRIEERKDLGSGDEQLYAYWQGQEKIAEKEERKWVKQAREIIKRYRDERPSSVQNIHHFNILWSNVQTLKPTLYARTPKPDVQRRFLDTDKDGVGRLAATLLENCLALSIERHFDAAMAAVVEDRLLPGRGVARVLYVPTLGDKLEEDEGENAAETVTDAGDQGQLREVKDEKVKAHYVFWEDYQEGPARQWEEVPWVRYRSYLTKEELIKRFGKAKANKVTLDYTPKGVEGAKAEPPPDLFKKAIVHEVWDKCKKEVVWYPPGTPDLILDRKDDPLELTNFFPSPDPLFATTTNDKRVPVPDYHEYQDQALELDNLTGRIRVLQKALKVSGVYAGEEKAVLQQLIDEGTENKLIPVGDWTAWADKGGMKTFIEWLPIKQVAETLVQLYAARDKAKQVLYEITGLSDILRGETNPNETFGAQELKANFATRRISPQQKEVARFARDMLRLMGGVIANQFAPETISKMTGYPQLQPVPPLPPRPTPLMMAASFPPPSSGPAVPPGAGASPPPAPGPSDPAMQAYEQQKAQWEQAVQQAMAIEQANQQKQQQFMAAVQLIKEDYPHGFKLDIEADSTIAPDEQQEKQSRTEFMGAFIPLMEQVVPLAMGNPAMAAMAKELVLFGVRGFRVARPLEESIEKAFEAIGQMPQNPKVTGQDQKAQGPQGPHPAEIAADVHNKQTEIAADSQARQAEIASDAQTQGTKIASDAQAKGREQDTKLAIAQMTLAQKAQSDAEDRRLKEIEIAGKFRSDQQKNMLAQQKNERDAARNDAALQHKQSSDAARLT